MSTSYVALLRGINVGGNKLVAMADLRDLLTELGFSSPRSLLQSGNLLFEGRPRSRSALERALEDAVASKLDVRVDFIVRTGAEWHAIVAANRFPKEAAADPSHLAVMCLKASPAAEAVTALNSAIVGREVVRSIGSELYVYYPDGMGKSKLTHALIERKLGVHGTARNWNTTLKIAAALS